jgi:hypothetical protein
MVLCASAVIVVAVVRVVVNGEKLVRRRRTWCWHRLVRNVRWRVGDFEEERHDSVRRVFSITEDSGVANKIGRQLS